MSPSVAGLTPAWLEALQALGVPVGTGDDAAALAGVKKVVLAGMLKKRVTAAPLCARIDTLAPLAACTALTELDLTRSPIRDLSPLAGLANLKRLIVWSTAISDLAPLAGKKKLSTLAAWCTAVSDLSPLAGTPALEELNVEYTEVRDLAPLRGLKKLRELNISGTAVTDLSPLATVPVGDLIAYRTPLSAEAIEAFRRSHPKSRIQSGEDYPAREVRCGC